MAVIAEETRNHTQVHRSVAAAAAQVVLEVMVPLVQAEDSESLTPMHLAAVSSMEPEVAARVATPEPSHQVDQVLVVMAGLIQRDRRLSLIPEVAAAVVEPQDR